MSQNTFSRLSPNLQTAIGSRLGWTSLRPVQEEAGQALLDGDNAVILAPTAGGKTEASMFPALSMLLDEPTDAVGVLYVAPIKALLNNQEERLGQYTEMVGLRCFVWHGDARKGDKTKFINEPAELLMTTPESLEVMLVSAKYPTPKLFRDLRMVVVDEVHAFAGSDRGAHFMSVLERIADLSKHDVQRVGLSATVGNPAAILDWISGTSKRPGRVVDPPKPRGKRSVAVHLEEDMDDLALAAATVAVGYKSLFFCQSRAMTEVVAESMRGRGVDVFVHHSSVSREEREEAEKNFTHGGDACIACTSTLELGIDVGDLDKVLQANCPDTVSSFLQRMGRTGRREGKAANTTFLVEDVEVVLQACAIIELAKKGWVEAVPINDRCFPVLVHQVLALVLQYGGIARSNAWSIVGRGPDFRGISKDEYEEIVDHMVATHFLYETSGRLAMGDRAEKVFGKKNFMELYAVFSSPVLYRVITAAKAEIGSLEQAFVDNLVEDMSSFLLGGRAWVVEHINHKERTVRVAKAPAGKKPAWGGFIPQMLSLELCQEMRRILVDDAPLGYLAPAAADGLASSRADLGESLRAGAVVTRSDDSKVLIWTFAGGKINHTLKYIFSVVGGWKVTADNTHLRVEGENLTPDRALEVLETIKSDDFWVDEEIWSQIYLQLPEYRLSKFQPALPDRFGREMVANYLLDIPGARAFVRNPTEPVKELLQGSFVVPTQIFGKKVLPAPIADQSPDVAPDPATDPTTSASTPQTEEEKVWAEVTTRRGRIERKLRTLVHNVLVQQYGVKSASTKAMACFSQARRAELDVHAFADRWKHAYFKELIVVIKKNWSAFQNLFANDKAKVLAQLEDINKYRVDAHAGELETEELNRLRDCLLAIERVLEKVQ